MFRTLIGALGLAALWLLMSGLWDKTLILIFGLVSVIITIVLMRRLDQADGETLEYALSPIRTLQYLLWLLKEIAVSNIAVAKLVLSGKELENQRLFMVPVSCKTELGQVMFANSITLTPGTITVETENDQFIVHALDYADEDLNALADMDRRVSETELGSR